MAFFTYVDVGFLWNTKFSFKPGAMATMFGLSIVLPLYIRGTLKWNTSPYTIISFVLISFFFASMVQFAMGGNGTASKITMYLLVTSAVLSWLGMKSIAGMSWILVLGAVVTSLIKNEAAMGMFGFLYIATGFLGLVLHSGMNPGHLMNDLKGEFKKQTEPHLEQIKEDMKSGVSAIGSIASATVPLAAVVQNNDK